MQYLRLLSRINGQPLAILEAKLDVITNNITLPLLAGNAISSQEFAPTRTPEGNAANAANATNSFAIIPVFDSLAAKNAAGDSGITTYETISKQIASAQAAGVKKIGFYIDSPGGEVSGLFGLASIISSLPSKGIETFAITDGLMASAAYVLGSATQRVYATDTSIVGSLATIATLVNMVEADKKAGLEYLILRSKSEKALINPHETFSPSAIEDMKTMLAKMDRILNETVLKNRKMMSLDTIINLNGRTVLGEEALQLNLIDNLVGSFEDAIAMESKTKSNVTSVATSSVLNKRGKTMSELEQAQAEVIRLTGEVAAIKGNLSLEVAKAKLEEQNRCLGIFEAAETFGLKADVAIKRIKANTDVSTSVEMFEAIKEAIQTSNPSPVGTTASLSASVVGTTPPSYADALIGALENKQTLFAGIK